MIKEIENYERRMQEERKIQQKYNFEIPSYVLSEMKNINDNVFMLIGLARVNKRISEENAKVLIEDLKKKQVSETMI